MKKRHVYLYIVGLLLVLAGCGAASEDNEQADSDVTESEGTVDMDEENKEPEQTPSEDNDENGDASVIPEGEDEEELDIPMATIYEAPYRGEPIELVQVLEDLQFDQPLYLTHAPGDGQAVYIVEKTGRIKRIQLDADNQVISDETYLDLSDVVSTDGSEKGLLGLAFHPDYALNGEVYVNYTQGSRSVIAKYINGDPTTGVTILTFEQPNDNHNGGQMVFGPDGYLYIGTGDGGGAGDPNRNAQNLTTLPGSILRIDVNQSEGERPYVIPEDNPFVDSQEGSYREEIFAYGFRNPWRFSYDRYRDRFIIADVGQDAREEIDILEKGGNYGWPRMEGTAVYDADAQIVGDELIEPVWEYEHPVGKSITGGYVIEGPENEVLTGLYVYGDFVSGMVWGLWWNEENVPTHYLLAESGLNIASFGKGPKGEVYIVDFTGGIYKIMLK